MSGEERVFAVQSDGADGAFDRVVVEFDAAIVEEPAQAKERHRAVFAKSEIASLLFEHMSRASALHTLDLLVRAGLLFERNSDPLIGPNRKLMFTDGFLEDAVSDYLSNLGAMAFDGDHGVIRGGSG